MHKTRAQIGDKVIILRDRWENILLDRNELPIIYGTVVKKYESEDISYHGSIETEIITVKTRVLVANQGLLVENPLNIADRYYRMEKEKQNTNIIKEE